ncbi:unnamed protein product [Mycena citricolor]|uniref:Deacetylase sirtuin-type domain-containing protein n=1 Tax=Mycena citricolor TaxID=2018698 RepID=A0AAD2H444_9AGAR|nr:unnamed protein product [Mycena citricolor]
MTLFVPLDASTSAPPSPPFLQTTPNPAGQLGKTIKTILKAKRIVVICGAGISVQAGIPDFRSPEGLFQTLKRDNPKEALASGKDLFDASVFNSENTTALFCQMIARLSELSTTAEPTPFHKLLRALDDRGRLLRVYTQNIDAIEQKSGLSFGVPPFEEKRSKSRTPKIKDTPPLQPVASTSRLSTPSVETPRCIPLHGTLQSVHCQICNHSFTLADHLESLGVGVPPECPECTAMETTRQLVGKRSRGIGRLRPSVVLYNEAHKDGEGVGDVVQRDLMGSSKGKGRSGADLLIVVGTSLRVPGTKRMVREFSKAVKSRGRDGGLGAARPSPTPPVEEDPPAKAIYLNFEFPVPIREWEGVFDTWLQGDAQSFAHMLQEEINKEVEAKHVASEKKRRKEEQMTELPTKDLLKCSEPGQKRRKITLKPPVSASASDPSPTTKLFLTIPARRMIPQVCMMSSSYSTPDRTARPQMVSPTVMNVDEPVDDDVLPSFVREVQYASA